MIKILLGLPEKQNFSVLSSFDLTKALALSRPWRYFWENMKSYGGARSCENFAYEVPVSRIPAAAVAAGALMSICDALNFGKIGVFGKVARSLRKFAYAFCGRKNGPCLPSAARSPLLLYHMGARLSRGKTKKIGEVLPSPNLNETAVKSSS